MNERKTIPDAAAIAEREAMYAEARRLIAELKGHSATFDSAYIGPTPLEQEAASFIETWMNRAALHPAAPEKTDGEAGALKSLHKELGQMHWIGSDEGWDLAIEAVRTRITEIVAEKK